MSVENVNIGPGLDATRSNISSRLKYKAADIGGVKPYNLDGSKLAALRKALMNKANNGAWEDNVSAKKSVDIKAMLAAENVGDLIEQLISLTATAQSATTHNDDRDNILNVIFLELRTRLDAITTSVTDDLGVALIGGGPISSTIWGNTAGTHVVASIAVNLNSTTNGVFNADDITSGGGGAPTPTTNANTAMPKLRTAGRGVAAQLGRLKAHLAALENAEGVLRNDRARIQEMVDYINNVDLQAISKYMAEAQMKYSLVDAGHLIETKIKANTANTAYRMMTG